MPLSYHTVFASGCSSIDCDDAQGQQIGENQFLKFSADCRDGCATVCRFGDFAARFTLHDARATGCNASLHASHEVERCPIAFAAMHKFVEHDRVQNFDRVSRSPDRTCQQDQLFQTHRPHDLIRIKLIGKPQTGGPSERLGTLGSRIEKDAVYLERINDLQRLGIDAKQPQRDS